MKTETIARTYAAALIELAAERGELDAVHEETIHVARLLEGDETLRSFIESPKIDRAEKLKVLQSALGGRITDTLLNFLLLVVRKGRQLFLRQMLAEYSILHDQRIGLVHVHVTSAVPLSGAAETLRLALEARLGKRVALDSRVDEEILGGLIVRYDGMVVDGSIRSALGRIAAGMKAIKFGSEWVHEN